ncbi:hypothetical protein VP01_4266g1 [Puccinia sorghi]|uniref:Uncharacterized protein n=1 Tax=Puccinia sorghi TaxID=27349 RepID=A0A0L6UQC7_9BASI|nr:hypothetical protein VP01_4266g1 [Puccinia sorghi]
MASGHPQVPCARTQSILALRQVGLGSLNGGKIPPLGGRSSETTTYCLPASPRQRLANLFLGGRWCCLLSPPKPPEAQGNPTSSDLSRASRLKCMDPRPASRIVSATSVSSSSLIPLARNRRNNLTRIPIIQPPRFKKSLKARPPHGGHVKLSGLRAIPPPGPTVSIRPASLLYRAPAALHGTASNLLRHILHRSSPAPSRRGSPPTAGSPVKFLSLPTRAAPEFHGPLCQSDAILHGFLLNNGGYLDDSDSESEPEDLPDRHTAGSSILDLRKNSRLSLKHAAKSIEDLPKSRYHCYKASIESLRTGFL